MNPTGNTVFIAGATSGIGLGLALRLHTAGNRVIDYRTVDFTNVVTDADLVLDTVGGTYGPRSIHALRPGGLLVTVVDRADTALRQAAAAAGRRFAGVTVEPDHLGLQEIAKLVDTGHLRPYVEDTLPLANATKAHQLIEPGRTQGKIVLTLRPDRKLDL